MNSKISAFGFCLALVVSAPALRADCGKCEGDSHAHSHKGSPSLAAISEHTGDFKTLLTAVKAAGLVDALGKAKPVTIFAPTDKAFAKLPEGTIAALLEDKAKLRSILQYHVVKGNMPAEKVLAKKKLMSISGRKLPLSTKDGARIAGAKIVKTDIQCNIGTIHVIDTVMMPPADIVDVAQSVGSFKTLLTAVDAAGLTDTLRSKGPFTVLAPTDEAFAALPEGTVAALLKDKKRLKSVLLYHVVSGNVPAAKVAKLTSVNSVQGSSISVGSSTCEVSGVTTVKLAGATVVKADVQAANGVIHVIDKVILPPAVAAK